MRGYRRHRHRQWNRKKRRWVPGKGFLRRRQRPAFGFTDPPYTPVEPILTQPAQQSLDEAYEALIRARRTATEIVQRAKDEAEMILETARNQAETITFDARSLSQDFLDRLRDLRQRAASLELEEPAAIVRRLMANTPPRPDVYALGPSRAAQRPPNGDLTAAAAMFWAEGASSDRAYPDPGRGSSLRDDFWLPHPSPP